MLRKYKVYLILFLLILVSCTSFEADSKVGQDNLSENNIREIAIEKFGKDFSIIYNKQRDYILCMKGNKSNIPNTGSISYFVYDNINNKIVIENKLSNGMVSWYSDYELKIVEIPGIIQKNQTHENGYILNIKTNSKTKMDGGIK